MCDKLAGPAGIGGCCGRLCKMAFCRASVTASAAIAGVAMALAAAARARVRKAVVKRRLFMRISRVGMREGYTVWGMC